MIKETFKKIESKNAQKAPKTPFFPHFYKSVDLAKTYLPVWKKKHKLFYSSPKPLNLSFTLKQLLLVFFKLASWEV